MSSASSGSQRRMLSPRRDGWLDDAPLLSWEDHSREGVTGTTCFEQSKHGRRDAGRGEHVLTASLLGF